MQPLVVFRQVFRCIAFAMLACCAGFACCAVADEPDPVQLQMLDAYQLPRRWDNVKAEPFWWRGVPPEYHAHADLHVVTLRPGQSTAVKIPPWEVLRVSSSNCDLQAANLQLLLSNGSGLLQQVPPVLSRDRHSMLLFPDASHTSIATIRLPIDASAAVSFAVFLSRTERLPQLAPFRNLLVPADRQPSVVDLHVEGDATGQPWESIPQDGQVRFRIEGPARLALESRVRWPASERRMHLNHRIDVFNQTSLLRQLEVQTSPEQRRLVNVDDCPCLLGQKETHFVHVPCGLHEIRIRSSADVFLRVLQQDDHDYLLPALNQPKRPAQEVSHQSLLLHVKSSWDVTANDFALLGQRRSLAVEDLVKLSQASWKRNQHPDGGLRAWNLLREAAAHQSQSIRVRQLADHVRSRHTFFRDLVPSRRSSAGEMSTAWFDVPSLMNPTVPRRRRLLADQHTTDGLRNVAKATFVGLADSPLAADEYRLAVPRPDSVLRLAVDRRTIVQPTRLLLQFDDRPPIVFDIGRSPIPERNHFQITTAEMSLSRLAHRHSVVDAGTIGGPFTRNRQPAEWLPAGAAEVLLPAGIQRIRLWADQPEVRASLQMRASRSYSLSESEFHSMVDRLAMNSADVTADLQSFLFDPEAVIGLSTYEAKELRNHFLPTARRIASLAQQFDAATTVSPVTPKRIPLIPASESNATFAGKARSKALPGTVTKSAVALLEEARKLEQAEQWVLAVEKYSQLLSQQRVDADVNRAAFNGRIDSLVRLGETRLAKRLQQLRAAEDRGQISNDEKPYAFKEQQEDPDSLLRRLSAEFRDHPTIQNQIPLAKALAADGHFKAALDLCLALPRVSRPADLTVRCAWHEQWWSVFEDHLQQLDQMQRAEWQARRSIALGQVQQAIDVLSQTEPATDQLLSHIQRSLSIVKRLVQSDTAALEDWVSEWYSVPGPQVWKTDSSVVRNAAGVETLYSRALDLRMTAFTTTPDRPVKLNIQGPARFRVELRLIHDAQQLDRAVNDWVIATINDQQQPIAITNNRPSTGLTIEGTTERPGKKVVREYEVPAGRHMVLLQAERGRCLVRCELLTPELALGILPPPNSATAEAVRQGVFGKKSAVQWCDGTVVSFGLQPPDCGPVVRQSLVQQAIRLPSAVQSPQALINNGDSVPPEILPVTFTEPNVVSPSNSGPVSQMERLAYLAEHHPLQRDDAIVAGERLFRSAANVPGIGQPYRRLTAGQTWQSYTQVLTSAGLRSVPISDWQPESPSLRIRKALLGTWQPDDIPLYGDQGLETEIDEPQPSTLDVRLSLASGLLDETEPCVVCFQLDDQKIQHVQVPETRPIRFQSKIPAGRHVVRLWLQVPDANHYVRTNLQQITRTDQQTPPVARAIRPEYDRMYHVATRKEPLVVRVAAPAVIRIDELRDGQTFSTYQFIQGKAQQLTIQPADDRSEGLFRVFRQVDRQTQSSDSLQPFQPDSQPSIQPLVPLQFAANFGQTSSFFTDDIAPLLLKDPGQWASVGLDDASLQLRDQEDPTWSIRTERVERRPLEEGLSSGDGNEFLQLSFTRRHRTHWNRDQHWDDQNSRTEFISRWREQAGHSFGIRHAHYDLVPAHSATLIRQASAWVQNPLADTPGGSGTEWAFSGRVGYQQYREINPKFGHLPSATLFGRVLSLSDSDLPPNFLDQDVFTSYKANHRLGLRFSDTLLYRPWLDTRLTLRGSLATNEELLTLDNFSVKAGWDQSVGPAEFAAAYRWTQFFEDTDRQNHSSQNVVEFVGRLDLFFAARRRFEVGLKAQHDVDAGTSNVFASLEWFLDNRRDYADLRSTDSPFLRLRKIRAARKSSPRFVNPTVFDPSSEPYDG